MTHLILIGHMGAGKSSVGRACADLLHWGFVDTDEMVAAEAKASIPEIFATEGEEGFRKREREAIGQVCGGRVRTVIACGGGAVLDPDNREVMRGAGKVVWLRAPVSTLVARVGSGAARPLLSSGPPEEVLERLARERDPLYEATADFVVDAEADVTETASAVLKAVGLR